MNSMVKAIISLFLLTPAMAMAVGGHYESGEVKCLDCHATMPGKQKVTTYSDTMARTCRACHSKFHGQSRSDNFKHPIDVVPSVKIRTLPPDMPLNRAGQMTCTTCHTYHADKNKHLLRRPAGKSLCLTCHKSL